MNPSLTIPIALFIVSIAASYVPLIEREARLADVYEPDLIELYSTNEGFRNLTNHGVPHKRVVGILSAVGVGFNLLKGIAGQIDLSRVCVIGFSNLGNRRLVEPEWYLENGIINEPLPLTIDPGQAGVFTFEKTHYAIFGTAGVFTYNVEGTKHKIVVMWTVPENYVSYSNEFNVHIMDNATASDKLFDYMKKDEMKVQVYDSGHWLSRSIDGINIHGAMTNNAKASYLVRVEYNYTTGYAGEPIFG